MLSLPKVTLCVALALVGCTPADQPPPVATTVQDPDSPAAKIADAMSAAPQAIADGATILDFPTDEGQDPPLLREGTNGWTCIASAPATLAAGGHDPMCADPPSMAFLDAYLRGVPPEASSVGIMYMLQGDAGSSNTDPNATGPTPDNEWVVTGPHIMIVVPDAASLDEIPTDPAQGGPFVMWKGTPYAHIMVPIAR